MFPRGRMLPVESRREKHVFRGLVTEHVDHTTGRWFWKKSFPSIKVQFPEAEHRRLIQVCESTTYSAPNPPNFVEIGFKKAEERAEYPIGTVVEVTLSTSNQIDEFFTGSDLFRWDGVKKAYYTSHAL